MTRLEQITRTGFLPDKSLKFLLYLSVLHKHSNIFFMTITHSIHKSLTIEGTPIEDPEELENGVKYFIETGSGFAGASYLGVINGKYTFMDGIVKYTYSVDNTDVLTGVYLPE